MMNIIQRNFINLLRCGAFKDNVSLEPMSPWKWNILYGLSQMHSVYALIVDGMISHNEDPNMNIPLDLQQKLVAKSKEIETQNRIIDTSTKEIFALFNNAQLRPILLKGQAAASLYPSPSHRIPGDVDIYFPFPTQAQKAEEKAKTFYGSNCSKTNNILRYQWKNLQIDHHTQIAHFANSRLNKNLASITEEELRRTKSAYTYIDDVKVEILPNTLFLLQIIARTASYIISEGVNLKQLVDLGIFLKTKGNDVDYIKLQKWIERLKLESMAQIEGELLVELFGFDTDEIPFMNGNYTSAGASAVLNELFLPTAIHNDEWYFTQGRDIFVKVSNKGAMAWQIRHFLKFFKFYPQEATSYFTKSFIHSISHIEE